MGSCLSRSSFTVNKRHTTESIRTYPVLFSMTDAESVLRESDTGTYLLYKDYESDKIYLSVRLSNRIRHHRISEVNRLFYLEKQPYPYLDSIIFYHRRHKLRGVRLKQQAHLSARVVKAFSHKIAAANGNLPDHHPHPNPHPPHHPQPASHPAPHRHIECHAAAPSPHSSPHPQTPPLPRRMLSDFDLPAI